MPRKHEYKFIGTSRNIHRLRLWSMDSDGNVEEVKVDRLAYIGMSGKEVLKARANLDPRMKHCYALNAKNAKRKMSKE